MRVSLTPPDPVPLAPQLYHSHDHFVNYYPQDAPAGPRPAFSTPSYSAAAPRPRYQIASGGEWARITRPRFGPPEARPWKRGNISTFSDRSRSRMLQSLAKIDRRRIYGKALFVTLTYPNRWPPTTAACKAHLEALRKRIERRWPRAWFYWKLEYQRRGAEHFHLLVFNMTDVEAGWLNTAWRDIVRLGGEWHETYGVKVDELTNWKEVGQYCAKYVAKLEQNPTTPTPGRFWGIATRRNRVETIIGAELSDGEFYRIRRMFRRYMHRRRGYHAPGGPTSGAWTRISNGGAKKMLGGAAGDDPPPRLLDEVTGELIACGPDRLPRGNYSSSTNDWPVDSQTTPADTSGKTNMGLYDSADLARRRARLLA